jgi:hypothetical protein
MSLLLSASPYKSDENTNKKRTSTMRKFIKAKPSAVGNNQEESNEYSGSQNEESVTEGYENVSKNSIDNLQTINDNRNIRINDILDKMTSSENDDNNKMGDFKPIEHPSLNVKKDLTETDNSSKEYVPSVPSYVNAINNMKSGKFSYAGVPTTAPNMYSNYNQSYETPPTLKMPSYMTKASASPSIFNDHKLMERINYMIHLLEEQRNEKTSNITEEFILYTFLGIFVIYIVDSFARAGKYIR